MCSLMLAQVGLKSGVLNEIDTYVSVRMEIRSLLQRQHFVFGRFGDGRRRWILLSRVSQRFHNEGPAYGNNE